MGRPSIYTEELAAELCERIAHGETLRDVCRDKHMAPIGTVWHWIDDDREGFAARYNRARQRQMEHWADELLAIADDSANDWMERHDPNNPGWQINGENVQRSRLRSDNRKWLLSKLRPDKYGDRITHAGDERAPVQTVTRIEIVPVSPVRKDEDDV